MFWANVVEHRWTNCLLFWCVIRTVFSWVRQAIGFYVRTGNGVLPIPRPGLGCRCLFGWVFSSSSQSCSIVQDSCWVPVGEWCQVRGTSLRIIRYVWMRHCWTPIFVWVRQWAWCQFIVDIWVDGFPSAIVPFSFWVCCFPRILFRTCPLFLLMFVWWFWFLQFSSNCGSKCLCSWFKLNWAFRLVFCFIEICVWVLLIFWAYHYWFNRVSRRVR